MVWLMNLLVFVYLVKYKFDENGNIIDFEGNIVEDTSGFLDEEVTDLKVTFTQAEYYSPVSTPERNSSLQPGWLCNSQVWTFSNRCSVLSCRYPKRQVPKLLQICKK